MARLKSGLLLGALVPGSKRILSNQTTREFLAELTGTFILLINGFCAHVVYRARGQPIDIFAGAFCFGAGALVAISATLEISGAHLNPAVTTSLASVGRLSWRKVPHYLVAQYLGAFSTAFATWFVNSEVIQHFDPNSTELGFTVYVTHPGESTGLLAGFLDQVLGTGLLTFAVLAVDGAKMPRPTHAIYFALVITGLIVAFNYNAGAILNPARDLGPRIFCYILGYGSELFSPLNGHYWWLIAVVAPHVGGLLGAWYYVLLVDPSAVYEQDLNEKILAFNSPPATARVILSKERLEALDKGRADVNMTVLPKNN